MEKMIRPDWPRQLYKVAVSSLGMIANVIYLIGIMIIIVWLTQYVG